VAVSGAYRRGEPSAISFPAKRGGRRRSAPFNGRNLFRKWLKSWTKGREADGRHSNPAVWRGVVAMVAWVIPAWRRRPESET